MLPEIRTPVPGPRSRDAAARLAAVECPEVTALAEPPIFWQRGAGANVYDADGNRYVDLLAGFGAAALGYAPPELSEALSRQAGTLQHAMGDVYPASVKLELLEELDRILPGDLGRAILSSSGSDAVESALKTSAVATGRSGVLAFEGSYHGLGLGALDTTHREEFRQPFRERLAGRTRFAPFGDLSAARAELERDAGIGAVLVEPIQGRGGLVHPPPGFLAELRELTRRRGVLLIADEVYTGIGRTGHWLACEREQVTPDLVCLGKSLGGGVPVSACAGLPEVMNAWPASRGEALHTSTHLGNPLGCAAALATLRAIRDRDLLERSRSEGERWLAELRAELSGCACVREVRGAGLLIGIEVDSPGRALRAARELLRQGWITLPEGPRANVLALSPPLTIPRELIDAASAAIGKALH
ncbi:MAG: aspartate aminotransferase family protein [Proteobacteria bacterium]|nr:aspartate aminotransferase family protein [Pseudomonadota bacterium]